MFRINTIYVRNHPILGNIELDFQAYYFDITNLFTTVIIGQNATGKSNILKLIVDLFRSFEIYKINDSKKPNIPYHFFLRYTIDNVVYEIKTSSLDIMTKRKGQERTFIFFKNKPIDYEYDNGNSQLSDINRYNSFKIQLTELLLPSKVIASSIMLTDKFNSADTDIYRYMGVRNPKSPSTAGTRTYIRRTVDNIIECLNRKNFKIELAELLQFLDLEATLHITYVPKYRNIFWTGNLTNEQFHNHFVCWKESFNRKGEPWGYREYKKIKEDEEIISKVVSLINRLAMNFIKRKRGVYFSYNILSDTFTTEDFDVLKSLDKLDLISYPSLHISKNGSSYNFADSSSGEAHFISSFIGILSQIDDNSLILIDEPEISLHPNWQMQYIHYLNTIFTKYYSCHFVIATHSHFIISDIKPDSSNIIALTRKNSQIEIVEIDDNTYGWSVDEILYKIFQVRAIRNIFFENDLRELYKLLSQDSINKEGVKQLLERVQKYTISSDDPLNKLIESANEILTNA
jgi:predicted ATP-dependent endonuclease of OLD family